MIPLVFSETINHMSRLMVHPFASSFVMKLIEVCNGKQWFRIFNTIVFDSQQLVLICYDNHGSKVVMKLLERLAQYLIQHPEETNALPDLMFRFTQALVAPEPGVVGLARGKCSPSNSLLFKDFPC